MSSPTSPSSLPVLPSLGALVLPEGFGVPHRPGPAGSRGWPWRRWPQAQAFRARLPRPAVTPVLALALVLVALLVAPEQPADQEAICQRHNGAAACRVW